MVFENEFSQIFIVNVFFKSLLRLILVYVFKLFTDTGSGRAIPDLGLSLW